MKTYICKRCVPHTCILQTHVHPVVCQSFPLKTKIKAEWVLKEPPNQEVSGLCSCEFPTFNSFFGRLMCKECDLPKNEQD